MKLFPITYFAESLWTPESISPSLWFDSRDITGYTNGQAISGNIPTKVGTMTVLTNNGESSPTYTVAPNFHIYGLSATNGAHVTTNKVLSNTTNVTYTVCGYQLGTAGETNLGAYMSTAMGPSSSTFQPWMFGVNTSGNMGAVQYDQFSSSNSTFLNTSNPEFGWSDSYADFFIMTIRIDGSGNFSMRLQYANGFTGNGNIYTDNGTLPSAQYYTDNVDHLFKGTGHDTNNQNYNQGASFGDFSGSILGIVGKNSYLSLADVQRIEGYLAHQFDLESMLYENPPNVATHPYRFQPPRTKPTPPYSPPSKSSEYADAYVNDMQFWYQGNYGLSEKTWLDASGNGSNYYNDQTASVVEFNSSGLNCSRLIAGTSGEWESNFINDYFGSYVTYGYTFFAVVKVGDSTPGANSSYTASIMQFSGNQKLSLNNVARDGSSMPSNFALYNASSTPNANFASVQKPVGNYYLVTAYGSASNDLQLDIDGGTSTNGTTRTTIPLYDNTYTVRTSPPSSEALEVAELIGMTRQLTSTERQEMQGYLAHKWNLEGSLPSSHPYKTSPPS